MKAAQSAARIKVVGIVSLAILGFFTTTAKATVYLDHICAGTILTRGDSLVSVAKVPGTNTPKYHLEFQASDGNLVLYQNPQGQVLFNAGTGGSAADQVIMQGDGNLVIYAHGVALKDSQVIPAGGDLPNGCNTVLELDADGKLRIVRAFPILWDSTLYNGALHCDSWNQPPCR